MKRTAYRLTQRRYQHEALSGSGSLIYDGRWHHAGIPVVYASESPALALLEILVHVERPRLLNMELALIPLNFDDALVRSVEAYTNGSLPPDWRQFPWPQSTQDAGTYWYHAGDSAILEVPSAVVPSMRNYLIDSRHPEFGAVDVGPPEDFSVDMRLTGG